MDKVPPQPQLYVHSQWSGGVVDLMPGCTLFMVGTRRRLRVPQVAPQRRSADRNGSHVCGHLLAMDKVSPQPKLYILDGQEVAVDLTPACTFFMVGTTPPTSRPGLEPSQEVARIFSSRGPVPAAHEVVADFASGCTFSSSCANFCSRSFWSSP